jgi:hypothetical protein
VAIDGAAERVARLVNMLSDGVLMVFIPSLEVLPSCQGQGIGTGLTPPDRRQQHRRSYLGGPGARRALVPYDERSGMRAASSALLRRPLRCRVLLRRP